MPLRKEGPLTRDELIDLWKSVTDRSYWEPILEDPQSRAIIESMAEMYARASQSVDTNTQAMFIRRWSGQTGEPAGGERKARTTLTVTRSLRLHQPLSLPGGVMFQQWLNDWGKEGPQFVTTERRYVSLEAHTFAPGEAGPLFIEVEAELAGYGFNTPAPGTIQRIVQAGPGLHNTGATVIAGVGSHELRSSEVPDVPIVGHVGATLEFTSGANTGQARTILGFVNPIPGVSGGGVLLAADGVFEVTGVTGTFVPNEPVLQTPSGAAGLVLVVAGGRMVVRRMSGNFVAGETITGETSGATATLSVIEQSPDLVAEAGTAGWRVLDWAEACGLQVTNPDFPVGGRSGMLDELGNERAIYRDNDAESDDVYRERVATPADVVSPNAIRRTANRILRPFCLEVCLREVGQPLFPGLFFDHDFFDYGRVTFTLTGGGAGFQNGEVVQQVSGGFVTQGRISIENPISGSPVFRGVDYVTGPGFVNGGTLTGTVSGASDTISSVPAGMANERRFNVLLDLVEFRGFFAIGVPPFGTAPQGTYYDAFVADNFFDAVSLDGNFYDGITEPTPVAIYSQIYQAVDRARAGGVPFFMYVEEFGCF